MIRDETKSARNIPRTMILLVFVVLFGQTVYAAAAPTPSSLFVPFGFQEPAYENSDSFATSILYDRYSRVVFLTGSTYSSAGLGVSNSTASYFDTNYGGLRYPDCFVHALTLSFSHPVTSAYGTELTPLFSRRLGTLSNAETCLNSRLIVPSSPIPNSDTHNSTTTLYSQLMLFGSVQTTSMIPPTDNYLLSNLMMTTTTPSISSSPSTLTVLNRNEDEEAGGFLSTLKPFGATPANNYGFLLQLQVASNYDASSWLPNSPTANAKDQRQATTLIDVTALKANIQSASLVQSVPTQHPIAFTCGPCGSPNSNSTDDMTFFVVYRTSSSSDPTISSSKDRLILQKRVFKSIPEMDYETTVMDTLFTNYFGFSRFNRQSSTAQTQDLPWIQGMKVLWNQPYLISQLADTVHDIIHVSTSSKPMLLLVGDVSLTQVDPETGKLGQAFQVYNNTFIQNNNKGKVQILRTCTHMEKQDSSATTILPFLYIVGYTTQALDNSTNSTVSLNKKLLVIQVDLTTMKPLWIQQVGSTHGMGDVVASDCVVTSDDEQVFIGGTVDAGDTLQIPSLKKQNLLHSSGGKDIVILGYQTRNGTLFRALQFGTSKDDSLASQKSLVLDEWDNLIVFGNTRGSFMRLRTKQEEMSSSPAWDFFVLNIERVTANRRPVTEFDHILPRKNKALLWFLFVPLLLLVCFLLIRTWNHHEKQRYGMEWTGSNDLVLQYLDNFKDDRVELHIRHSATGGIHGIYEFIDKQKALGMNSSSRSYSSRPYTLESLPGPIGYQQSIPSSMSTARSADFVRNSMFSIDDDDDEEENGNAAERKRMTNQTKSPSTSESSSKGEIAYNILSKRRNNWDDADYASLVESYDATWAERSAHTLS